MYVIYLLGRLRAERAIPGLLRHIAHQSVEYSIPPERRRINGPLKPWGECPAVEALIRIGLPAARQTAVSIGAEMDSSRRQLMLRVLREGGRAENRMRRCPRTLYHHSNRYGAANRFPRSSMQSGDEPR